MPGGAGAARLCLLVLALPLLRPRAVRAPGWTRRGSEEGSLPLQHELIIPQWKTAESLMREEHPPKAELRVMAEGRELILDLEKNEDLFAPTYTETHYTPSGSPRTTMLKSKDHCFYHGTVRKAEESSVTLSTCRGVSLLTAHLKKPRVSADPADLRARDSYQMAWCRPWRRSSCSSSSSVQTPIHPSHLPSLINRCCNGKSPQQLFFSP